MGTTPVRPAGGGQGIPQSSAQINYAEWANVLKTKLGIDIDGPGLRTQIEGKSPEFITAFQQLINALKTATPEEISSVKQDIQVLQEEARKKGQTLSSLAVLMQIAQATLAPQETPAGTRPGQAPAPTAPEVRPTVTQVGTTQVTKPEVWRKFLTLLGVTQEKIEKLVNGEAVDGVSLADGLDETEAKALGIESGLFKIAAAGMKGTEGTEDVILGEVGKEAELERFTTIIEKYAQAACINNEQALSLYNKTQKFVMLDLDGVLQKQVEAVTALGTTDPVDGPTFLTGRDPKVKFIAVALVGTSATITLEQATSIVKKEVAYSELISKLPQDLQKEWAGYTGLQSAQFPVAESESPVQPPTGAVTPPVSGQVPPAGQTPPPVQPGAGVPPTGAEGQTPPPEGTVLPQVPSDMNQMASLLNINLASLSSLGDVKAAYENLVRAYSSSLLIQEMSKDPTIKPADLDGFMQRKTSPVIQAFFDRVAPVTDPEILAYYNTILQSQGKPAVTAVPDREKVKDKETGKEIPIKEYLKMQLQFRSLDKYIAGLVQKSPPSFSGCPSLLKFYDIFTQASGGKAVAKLDAAMMTDVLRVASADKIHWYPMIALVYNRAGKTADAQKLLVELEGILTKTYTATMPYGNKANIANVYFGMFKANGSADYLTKAIKIYDEIWPNVKALDDKKKTGQTLEAADQSLLDDYMDIFRDIVRIVQKSKTLQANTALMQVLKSWMGKVAPLKKQ